MRQFSIREVTQISQQSRKQGWIDSSQKLLLMEPMPNALLTDLYQLNMIQAYLESGQTDTAVFEFFVRKLPYQRSFLMEASKLF